MNQPYRTEACDRIAYWWDGEYEGHCERETRHEGPHFDGAYWFDDDSNEVEPPTPSPPSQPGAS